MATVATQGLEWSGGFTIGNVDFAVARTAADQQARLVGCVLQEAQIPNRSVVHREFNFLAFQLFLVFVEAHQFHGFIVRTGRNQVTHRGPSHTVDRTLVVFRSFEQDRWLVGGVVFPGSIEKWISL